MLYRFTLASSAAALTSLALVAACSSSDLTQPSNNAFVRVANASPTTAVVTASSDGRAVAYTVSYQNATVSSPTCGLVEIGNHESLDFGVGGNALGLASVEFPFNAGQIYTAVLFGPNSATIFPDVFTPPSVGNNAIRFINATGAAGDVYLTTPDAAITAPPTVANLDAGAASGFDASLAPGGTFNQYSNTLTRVRMFDPGVTTGTPRVDFTISSVPSNRVSTVVLTPPPVGGTTTAFMTAPCGF